MPHDNRAARAGLWDWRDQQAVRFRNHRIDEHLGMWDWAGDSLCRYCATPLPRGCVGFLGHCRRPVCRAIYRYYARGGGARRSWMHGSAWPLWEIIGYLRAMANSPAPLACEFGKRFDHRNLLSRRTSA